MKNKKLLLLIVLLILIVGTVAVTALSNPFRGMGSGISSIRGRIGGGISGVGGAWGLIHISVNALIIAAVIYFGLSLIPFTKPSTKPGQIILVIVAIIFGIMFAVQIGGDKFIWEAGAFEGAIKYLFWDTYEDPKSGEDVNGILNPSHIWKFIGMALLMSWLFVTFLKVGESKQYIDIALAIIISASAVHNGLAIESVVKLGRIIALFILTVQFTKTFNFTNKKWNWIFSFFMALGLIYWISGIVFPGYPWLWGKKVVAGVAAVGAGTAAGAQGKSSWVAQLAIGILAIAGGSVITLPSIFRRVRAGRGSPEDVVGGETEGEAEGEAEREAEREAESES